LVLQDVGTMKSLHWRSKIWFDCVERKRSAKLLSSARAPCTFAAAPSFQACLRAFICTFCVFVNMCMCVCVRTCIYVYICMCVCIYISTRLYTCVCVCVCIFVHRLWFWYQCFSVWTVSCMRMCFRVHTYAYTYVCGYMYMCIFLQ